LHRALSSGYKYEAIEVDLSYVRGIIRLAHHKDDSDVDITLSSFLTMLESTSSNFVIKFDFKDIHSVTAGITLIASSRISEHHSLICNVDGVQGPAGRPELIISASRFQALVRAQLPASEVSIGMTTGWHVSSLFYSHGYTGHHAHMLADVSNVTYALRMTILAQTNPDVVAMLFHKKNVLVWGETGLFENTWLSHNKFDCLDRDIWGPGSWVIAQYAWIFTVLLLGCICIFFFLFRSKIAPPYSQIPPDKM